MPRHSRSTAVSIRLIITTQARVIPFRGGFVHERHRVRVAQGRLGKKHAHRASGGAGGAAVAGLPPDRRRPARLAVAVARAARQRPPGAQARDARRRGGGQGGTARRLRVGVRRHAAEPVEPRRRGDRSRDPRRHPGPAERVRHRRRDRHHRALPRAEEALCGGHQCRAGKAQRRRSRDRLRRAGRPHGDQGAAVVGPDHPAQRLLLCARRRRRHQGVRSPIRSPRPR